MIAERIQRVNIRLSGHLFCVFALFLSIAFIGNLLACAVEVTVEDIVGGYKNNASQFYQARVLYRTTTSLDKRFLYSSKLNVDLSNVNLAVTTFEIDYWTNFEDLLIRGGEISEDSLKYEKGMSLSGVLNNSIESGVTTADLESHYRKTQVFTYFGQDKTVRYWIGYDTIDNPLTSEHRNVPKAVISDDIPLIRDSKFLFPPFLPFSRENKESIFPTDAFFDMPLDNLKLLGTIISEGETYVVLENREMMPKESYNLSNAVVGTKYEKSDIRMCHIFRAWVSIKKGCLPVRLEKFSCFSVDGRLSRYVESLDFNSKTSEVFEVQEIKELSHGIFYPVKASMKLYSVRQDSLKSISPTPASIVETLDGNASQISLPMDVCREQTWEIVRVIPEVDISEETLKLPFPKGTELYDIRTRKTSLVGITEAEYEQIVREEEEKARMLGVVPDSGMVFPDPNAKWSPEDFILRAPQGWQTAFLIIGINFVVLGLILRYFFISQKRNKRNKDKKE